jgi:hypothetical protein
MKPQHLRLYALTRPQFQCAGMFDNTMILQGKVFLHIIKWVNESEETYHLLWPSQNSQIWSIGWQASILNFIGLCHSTGISYSLVAKFQFVEIKVISDEVIHQKEKKFQNHKLHIDRSEERRKERKSSITWVSIERSEERRKERKMS